MSLHGHECAIHTCAARCLPHQYVGSGQVLVAATKLNGLLRRPGADGSYPADLKPRPSPRSTLYKVCTPAVCCQSFVSTSLIRSPSFDFAMVDLTLLEDNRVTWHCGPHAQSRRGAQRLHSKQQDSAKGGTRLNCCWKNVGVCVI